MYFFRYSSTTPSEDRCSTSDTHPYTPTLPGVGAGVVPGADPRGQNGTRTRGEEGTLPGGKARTSAHRETSSYNNRKTHTGPRVQAISRKGSCLQDDLSSWKTISRSLIG